MTRSKLKGWMWQFLSPYTNQYKFMDEFDAKLDELLQNEAENLPISNVSQRTEQLKVFRVADIRAMLKSVDVDITFSKMVELMNEMAYKKYAD